LYLWDLITISILALTLSKKLKKAMEGLSDTKAAYQGLTESLSQEQIQDWIRQEKQASRHRGDALKIYEVQQEKGP